MPAAVGAIPVVGGLVKSADAQAQWMQEMLEQNARLLAQFPATMKTFNDSLDRFNQTVAQLDRVATQIETATRLLTGTVDRIIGVIEQLPGAALMRRMAGRPADDGSSAAPKPRGT